MCGIAGFVQQGSVDLCGPLQRMHQAIGHRGPDDRGIWRSPGGHALYAHTRLSVIDPSPAGHQPMQIDNGRFTITYNGEIYNFAALRESLVHDGVAFRSNSDTEVLLRLYQAHGPSFVEQLRGMFAFAIWDERERTCFLARDRFGIKPLYYHESNGVLSFASELRALVRSGIVSPTIDPQAVFEFFRSGSVPEPLTLVKGVRVLEAAHSMTWRDGDATIARYWDINFPEDDAAADPVAATREALIDSVRHHFVSDVPVGVFLSGGMDSTAMVALATRTQDARLRTFSLTFPGSELDEGPVARRTAEHFGTDHHEWAVDATTARALVTDFLAAADQPSIDGFNTFTVSRLARQHDTKVVLSGIGGDELFGGYPSFREVPKLATWGHRAGLAGPVGSVAANLAGHVGGSRFRRVRDLITPATDLENAYSVFRGIYARGEALALTDYYAGSSDAVVEAASTGGIIDPTAQDAVSRLELTRYMRNQLLRDTDVMSMAWGVELRVPFLDSTLFAAVSRIPAATRLASGKALLLHAVPEIPEWVASRPKRGFLFPMAEWLDGAWAQEFAPRQSVPAVKMDTWYRKWAVLVFERWAQQVMVPHE
ncbi:MAG TPA: asparagine synthase (glutamine-hydrolyzing) [Vicinamibacterales bacterium]|nr:asparagine synthase (glutamine-hydrolyzing) [Vicinamibacterales bacterium]